MTKPITAGIFTIYTTKLMEANFLLSLMNKCDRLVLCYNTDGSVKAELVDMEQVPEPEPAVEQVENIEEAPEAKED